MLKYRISVSLAELWQWQLIKASVALKTAQQDASQMANDNHFNLNNIFSLINTGHIKLISLNS